MRNLYLILFISIVAVIGSCSVSESGVVGAWNIMADSRQHLPKNHKKAACKIDIFADGSFKVSEIPTSLFFPDESVPRREQWREVIVSGDGHWKLDRSGGQVVVLSFSNFYGEYEGHTPFSDQLSVQLGLNGPRLVYHRFDPDDIEGTIYFSRDKESLPE